MRATHVLLAIAAGAALAACHPKPLPRGLALDLDTRPMHAVDRLDCPPTVESLTRTGQAGDGRSCTYTGPQSEDVTLLLRPLDGQSADMRLAALDAQLKAEAPAGARGPNHGPGVYIASEGGHDQAHIDLPGFHLNASDDKASIRLPGLTVDADGDNAKVAAGGARGAEVNARNGGAEIRAGGVGANGADVTYLLASDTPGPSGYRLVGYVAKGPAAGPLVVGEFRVRQHEGHDGGDHGVDRLVDLNVHG